MTEEVLIVKLKNAVREDKRLIGDYAYALSRIADLEVKIPDGFVVTTSAYELFFQSNNLNPKIKLLLSTIHFKKHESVSQVSNHIQKLIQDEFFPLKLKTLLLSSFQNLKRTDNSINLIDQLSDEAITNIENEEKLFQAIRKLWSHAFSPQNLLSNINKLPNPKALILMEDLNTKITGSISTIDLNPISEQIILDKQTKTLVQIAKKVKEHFHFPQLIKFAIKDTDIFVTDIKPITNLNDTKLVLVRHGQSVWNARGLWTGWTDVDLSDKGRDDARDAGSHLRDIKLDLACTSVLKRAKQTLSELLKSKGQIHVPVLENQALNERDYGDYTGKNKWDIKSEVGDEMFQKIRRSWDYQLPNGESLKDVYHRVIPYYETIILPKLKSGKNVIISAHGNSLRALVKYLEDIPDDEISSLEIAVGEVYVYTLNEDGKIVKKEIRNKKENRD